MTGEAKLKFVNDHWQAVLLLSIIVPVVLIVGIKVFNYPTYSTEPSEITVLDEIVWRRERPSASGRIPGNSTLPFKHQSYGVCFDGVLWADLYDCDWLDSGPAVVGFGFKDFFASVSYGFVYEIRVNFSENYDASSVVFRFPFSMDNLTLGGYVDGGNESGLLTGSLKAFSVLHGTSEPVNASFANLLVDYSLSSAYNYTHNVSVSIEVTYFNGTVYKRVVQSFLFILGPDGNDDFDVAEKIFLPCSVAGFLGGLDEADFYRIYLTEGEDINVTLCFPVGTDFDVYLYSPANLVNASASSASHSENTEFICGIADVVGWWFVKVECSAGNGEYVFSVDTLPVIVEVTGYPFKLSIWLAKTTFEVGEHVNVSLLIENISNETLVLSFADGADHFWFIVYDGDWQKIYELVLYYGQGEPVFVNFKPGDKATSTYIWRQNFVNQTIPNNWHFEPVPAGMYNVVGVFLSISLNNLRIETPSIAITIFEE